MIKKLINISNIFSKKKYVLMTHNGIDIEKYPEYNWNLVPFPNQKGTPFNNDNLSTVNKSSFLNDEHFLNALKIAESRWAKKNNEKVRNISWRLHVFLWASNKSLKEYNPDNEIFLELGTGKGYMFSAFCNIDNNINPKIYLVDSFESTIPNIFGNQTENGEKSFVYADGDNEVREYFKKYTNVNIITGFVPQILDKLPQNKTIRFLHLDLNNHVAEEQALVILQDRFKTGSIILFDDYGGPGGDLQSKVHENFAKKINKDLLILPTGQALIII